VPHAHIFSKESSAMSEYEHLSHVALSRAAAERSAVLSAVAERKAESKRVRRQARGVRRVRTSVAKAA
jgi:hypothetical protein